MRSRYYVVGAPVCRRPVVSILLTGCGNYLASANTGLGLNVLSMVAWAQFPLIRALSTNIGSQGIRLASAIATFRGAVKRPRRAVAHAGGRQRPVLGVVQQKGSVQKLFAFRVGRRTATVFRCGRRRQPPAACKIPPWRDSLPQGPSVLQFRRTAQPSCRAEVIFRMLVSYQRGG